MVGDPVVWKRKGKAETAIKVWKGRPAHPRGCSPGQLAAVLLAVRCPSNIRVSVQASLPIHAAVLRAYRTKNGSSGLKAGTASVSFVVCSDVYR